MIKLLIVLSLAYFCSCSHYKGGTVTVDWRSPSVVILSYESYYRRNLPSPNFLCTQELIASQTLLNDTSAYINLWLCRSTSTTCTRLDASILHTFRCKNFDATENWSIVEYTRDIDLSRYSLTPQANDSIMFTLANNNWVDPFSSTPYYWLSYNRQVMVNNAAGQQLNSAPNVKTFPHRNLICGCEQSFQLLPTDADNDIVKCRLSKVRYIYIYSVITLLCRSGPLLYRMNL
jgi:hypothetical protein